MLEKDLINTYVKCLGGIISEEGEETEEVVEQETDEIEETVTSKEIDMIFSAELATEFSKTINEFTTVCAKMVKIRQIDKDTADKFSGLYSKIKSLADAAKKTE